MEHANREIQMLHEQQNTLLSLKQKAENKLREARHIQVSIIDVQVHVINGLLYYLGKTNDRFKNPET